eukprot:m51a1_g2218 putative protein phosphatase slingshot homolog 3 (210) ;mRNA; r:214786-215415
MCERDGDGDGDYDDERQLDGESAEAKMARISAMTGVPAAYLDAAPPSEVVAGALWLGSQFNAADLPALRRLRVTHIVNCARECADHFPGRFVYTRLALVDTDRQRLPLARAVDEVRRAVDAGGRVLVHCQCGVSRSAVVAAAYVARAMGLGVDEALAYVRQRRPVARPLLAFRLQLAEYLQAPADSMGPARAANPTADPTTATGQYPDS